jgi:hypothetical protein
MGSNIPTCQKFQGKNNKNSHSFNHIELLQEVLGRTNRLLYFDMTWTA